MYCPIGPHSGVTAARRTGLAPNDPWINYYPKFFREFSNWANDTPPYFDLSDKLSTNLNFIARTHIKKVRVIEMFRSKVNG